MFLLASAALANITFFDSMACEILLQLNAIHILLEACRDRQRVDTPYSKDQVHSTHTALCYDGCRQISTGNVFKSNSWC